MEALTTFGLAHRNPTTMQYVIRQDPYQKVLLPTSPSEYELRYKKFSDISGRSIAYDNSNFCEVDFDFLLPESTIDWAGRGAVL